MTTSRSPRKKHRGSLVKKKTGDTDTKPSTSIAHRRTAVKTDSHVSLGYIIVFIKAKLIYISCNITECLGSDLTLSVGEMCSSWPWIGSQAMRSPPSKKKKKESIQLADKLCNVW